MCKKECKKEDDLIDLIYRSERYGDLEDIQRENLLIELASALDPFPGFLGMDSIQAVELDLNSGFPDRGCLVVTDRGEIKVLSLDLIPGPIFMGGLDSKETFKDVFLEGEEKDFYLSSALQILISLVKEKSGFDC
tara:strand:- start:186 stop:590 length:405 start_codon:yes stop_codon:yes gene_type:complete